MALSSIVFDSKQSNLYIADSNDVVWDVTPGLAQTIDFPQLGPYTYGVSPVTLDAISEDATTLSATGLAVTYSSTSTPASIDTIYGSELSVTGAGTIAVTAAQAGGIGTNGSYYASASTSQNITVNKAPLTITADDVSMIVGTNPSTLTYSASYSGFAYNDTAATALTNSPAFSLSSAITSSSAVGSYPGAITVSQGTLAATNYNLAQSTYTPGTLTITGSTTQTINFPAFSAVTYGQTKTVALGASATPSNLAITYTVVSGPGKVSGSTLTITGAGTIVIKATQEGNNTYAGATPVTQSLIVNPAPLTVAAPSPTYTYGTAIATDLLTASPTINGWVGSDSSSLVTGSPTYTVTNSAGTVVTGVVDAGTYTLTPSIGTLALIGEAATNYTLSTSATPAATYAAGAITITQASQTISFVYYDANSNTTKLADMPFLPGVATQPWYSFHVSSSAGLTVTVTTSGPASIHYSGNNYYSLGSTTDLGQVTITATQAGNTDYAAATATQTFNVVKGTWPIYAVNAVIPYGAPAPTYTYTIGTESGTDPIGLLPTDRYTGIPTVTSVYTPGSDTGNVGYCTQSRTGLGAQYDTATCFPIVIAAGTLSSKWYNWQLNNGYLIVFPDGYFTMQESATSLTVPKGQARQITLAMAAYNDFTGTVTVSCSGLPAGVTCQLNPSTVTFSGSSSGTTSVEDATLTISAGDDVLTSLNRPQNGPGKNRLLPGNGLILAGGLFVLPLAFLRKRLARSGLVRLFILCAALLLGLSGLSACSTTASGTAQSGTTVVTVTATGSTYTTVAPQSFTLNLTVE